jgi:hypothetical protein
MPKNRMEKNRYAVLNVSVRPSLKDAGGAVAKGIGGCFH